MFNTPLFAAAGNVFWFWSCVPLSMYFLGRLLRGRNTHLKATLEEVVIEPPNVIKLVIQNKYNQAQDKHR